MFWNDRGQKKHRFNTAFWFGSKVVVFFLNIRLNIFISLVLKD